MLAGPVFAREAYTAPRRSRFYLHRSLYVMALLVLMCAAWLMLPGAQVIRNVGDMARFGSTLFQVLAPLQLALVSFMAAFSCASVVAQEKDRRTLVLLLMTRMSNYELVVGKMLAGLLNVLVMLAAALPVFMLLPLLGGVSHGQVARAFLVTLATTLAAGSLGTLMALWREKTFQTLSLTAVLILLWLGWWEAVRAGWIGAELFGLSAVDWSTVFSPWRAIQAATLPAIDADMFGGLVDGYFLTCSVLALVLSAIAIARLRVWNPSRELHAGRQASGETIWGAEHDMKQEATVAGGGQSVAAVDAREQAAETARAAHVDARLRRASGSSRRVWDNPILWREVCTWAYGRKVLLIRLGYLLLFAMAAGAVWALLPAATHAWADESATLVPDLAMPLAPFFLVSLVIINALAVTAITSERDGQALDLLLVTDLTPREFVFGKLGGALWVAKEMVLLPMLLCLYLWLQGALGTENLVFLLCGLLVMNLFVAMLGVHYGMIYANSRTAIGVSLGTVFFLFLGVVACMWMMVAFSDDSFHKQLAPFLACILGGGAALFVCLGARNPSPAIGTASLLLPFATFYAITSFLMQQPMAVFLVTSFTYGFTAAAMLIPAIHEFDIAMGRTKSPEES